ncbi:MAG: hypothetical protein KQJ78_08675 [Deltaproteobacteria bacterium]|nr:hypothetical protein [Deltaproteobacteria bacterium]
MAYNLPSRSSGDWDFALRDTFNQIDADVQAAGEGTAKVRVGPRAERLAYATPYAGLLWVDDDYPALWRYSGSAWQYAGGAEALGRKNLLINGAFNVAQRGTAFTSTTSPANNDGAYLPDRWCLLSDGDDVIDVSIFANPTAQHYLANIQETANKQWGWVQILEAKDTYFCNERVVSFAVSAKRHEANLSTSKVRLALLGWTGTADAVTRDVVAVWAGAGAEPIWAADWIRLGLTEPLTPDWAGMRGKLENVYVPDTVNNLAVFVWLDDTNAAVDDRVDLAYAQLEVGSECTAFEQRTYASELAICRRYYMKLGRGVPGWAANSSMITFQMCGLNLRVSPTVNLLSTSLMAATGGSWGDTTANPLSIIASQTHIDGLKLRLGEWSGLSTSMGYFTVDNNWGELVAEL